MRLIGLEDLRDLLINAWDAYAGPLNLSFIAPLHNSLLKTIYITFQLETNSLIFPMAALMVLGSLCELLINYSFA